MASDSETHVEDHPLADSDHAIRLGRRPHGKSDAWWRLSHEAKQILKEQRAMGRFGGTPGQAPYWMSQEAGNSAAEIEAQHYIQTALLEWRAQIGGIIQLYLRS